MADGPSYEAALKAAEVVIREWIETAKELGRPIQYSAIGGNARA